MEHFEVEFERLLGEQIRGAVGTRLEMLEKDLTGTRKLCEILFQAFGTLDNLVLEYELVGESGTRIYCDVYHRGMHAVFEALGYVVHAERITRSRHSFEQMRIRTFMKAGMKFVPFSWDELDKKPEMCLRSVYELMGRFGRVDSKKWLLLSVYERELIRCAMVHHERSFGMNEIYSWWGLGNAAARKHLYPLLEKGLITRVGGGERRGHRFRLTESVADLL